jgi:hypothetical protein
LIKPIVSPNQLNNQELIMRQTSSQKIAQFAGFILSPAVFSATVLAQMPDARSVEVLLPPAASAKILQTEPPPDRAGIQFQAAPRLNQGKLLFLTGTRTETTSVIGGKCIDSFYIPPSTVTRTRPYITQVGARATFISRTTPPAAGLRVIIQNMTPAVDQSIRPYTDREYVQSDRSEAFTVKQDITRSSRYLTVTPGTNTFAYQIQRGKQIVESGSFTTLIETETKADAQPEDSEPFSPTLNEASNPCETPELSHIKDIEVPDIEQMFPEIPALSAEIQQLIDEPNK